MRFIFIDEIQQPQKNENFFGVGAFIIDDYFYSKVCEDFHKYFNDSGWNKDIEFKGRYLFSHKGDTNVSIEKRIELVNKMAQSTVAKRNARSKFVFVFNYQGKTDKNYLKLVSFIIKDPCVPRAAEIGKKALVAIYYDRTDLINSVQLHNHILFFLQRKKLQLVEIPCSLGSCNNTVGLVYTDVFSYLTSWDVLSEGRDTGEEQQASLFSLGSGERDAEKLKKIKVILSEVKAINKKRVN